MKILSADIQQKYKSEICLVNMAMLFYLFRNAIPLFKYPFLLIYIYLLVYSVLNYRKRLGSTFIEFVRDYNKILILALLLVFSFLSSNKLYLVTFKDLANMFVLLSIFFITSIIVREKEFKFYVSNLVYLIAFFAVGISILGVMNVLGIFSLNDISQTNNVSWTISDISTSIDYNFSIIPSFFGIFVVLFLLHKDNSKLKIIAYNILLILFSINIILSGSRRGLLALIAILTLLLLAQLFTFIKKNDFLKKLGLNSRYFLISFFLMIAVSSLIVFNSDYAFKVKLLNFFGVKDIQNAKVQVVLKIMKYTSIDKDHSSFKEFYSRIWPTIPEDPDSGWGTRPHKTIFPLTGINVKILPKGIKGYLLDSTTSANYYDWIDLSENFTLVAKFKVTKGERCKASVYCFTSNDFDGSTASLSVQSSCLTDGIVFGKTGASYDMENKGSWQKLEIEFECNDGEVPIWMSFQKKGVKNFKKLKGYVIFAYPCSEKNQKSGKSSNKNKMDNTQPELFDLFKSETYRQGKDSSGMYYKIIQTNGSSGLKSTQHYGPNIILTHKNILYNQKPLYSSLFCFPNSILSFSGLVQHDSDPIRRFVSKLISEDTTYYPYKSNIVLDRFSNPFFADRLLRWQFSLEIFSKEYTWKQKLFGGGFNFLNWYGFYFIKDKTSSDWPHNPFLSILLYSGVLGLLIYCIFIYMVFYYYIKYIKEYPLLFFFFLITFFFSFFSGGSPFDPPVMGFFNILPFFIHSIHKRGKLESIDIEA